MKIVQVTGLVYRQAIRHRDIVMRRAQVARPHQHTVLVRVDTDAGLTGWGEAFGHFGVASTTLAALESIVARRAVGADAADPEALAAQLDRELHSLGGCGPVAYARSGLDIALWDLAAKAAGVPLHALLGGRAPAPPSLAAYASLMRYGDPDTVAAECTEALERGYAAVKIHEVDATAIDAARAVAARFAKPLHVDVNCAWNREQASERARGLGAIGAGWLEEPLWPPQDAAGLARLRAQSTVPIAAGENAASVADFMRLLASDAIDLAQPSVTKIGGVTAMLAIARAAAARGIAVAPHSPYFGPGLVATLHVLAALAPDALVEHLFYDLEPGPLGERVLAPGGRFAVPQDPGLGADPDPQVLENLVSRKEETT